MSVTPMLIKSTDNVLMALGRKGLTCGVINQRVNCVLFYYVYCVCVSL
ncbi:unnamed protein product [Staurois parvus]|uniref:Uncharacterized protein n=1 Tax=Staurois parvus TaxID=386267 RepID=A0ABN9EQP4_9NEOB|nr:unnamed protein product [Staurois parvus]